MSTLNTPPQPSTWQIINSDALPAPDLLQPSPLRRLDTPPLDVNVYFDPAIACRENETVWRRCWQMACREEQLPNAGDRLVYDIGDLSALIVRDERGVLRAFANSCPHRGTRLCDSAGNQQQVRCPFHGLTWQLDGELKQLPCAWDFDGTTRAALNLQPLRLETWDGFVFINFDNNAAPLHDYLEILPAHFQHWPLRNRFIAAHVAKYLDCNWKIALEAFVETFHVLGVHPQSLPFLGDANSQYDVWPGVRHISRMINVSGVVSPHVAEHCPPQRSVAAAAAFGLCSDAPLAPGETLRTRVVNDLRQRITEAGVDLNGVSDCEAVDVINYSVFPNLMLFGGFAVPLVYRVRPVRDNPQRCLFEVYLLLPHADDNAPPPAPMTLLADDQPFSSVETLSYFGPILDQDADLMGQVQRGLNANAAGHFNLSNYQEIRVRHLRQTLREYLQGN